MYNSTFLVSRSLRDFYYKLYFDANGGKCDTDYLKVSVNNELGELPTPTYDDKYFNGWYTNVSGGEQVTEKTLGGDDLYKIYAQWLNPYTITWDATTNGGELLSSEEPFYYYKGIAIRQFPEVKGPSDKPYLEGWFTTSSGDSGEKVTIDTIVGDTNIYYARYTDYNDEIGKYICPTKNLYFNKIGDTVAYDGSALITTDDVILDTTNTYTITSGDYSGTVLNSYSFTTNDSYRSGLSATISGNGTLKFSAKGSTEGNWDRLVIFIGGTYRIYMGTGYGGPIYGEWNGVWYNDYIYDNENSLYPYIYLTDAYGSNNEWMDYEININNDYLQEKEIMFAYIRDGGGSGGENKVWITNIQWIPS